MSTLYMLDYSGTLDTLGDPVGFIGALRVQDPGAFVVIVSGGLPPHDVVRAADAFWPKPFTWDSAKRMAPCRVIHADDDPILLRGCERVLRRLGFDYQPVEPEGLLTLIGE